MKRVLTWAAIGALVTLGGCKLFEPAGPAAPVAVSISVNAGPWRQVAPGDTVTVRPDYDAGGAVIQVSASGGGSGALYRATWREDMKAVSRTFSLETGFVLDQSSTVKIRSEDAEPLQFEVEIENEAPRIYVPFLAGSGSLSENDTAMFDLRGLGHGCDRDGHGEPSTISGIFDPDTAYGDRLQYKMRVVGPIGPGRVGEWTVYEKLGPNEYRVISDTWVDVSTWAYLIVGEGGRDQPSHPLGCQPVTPLQPPAFTPTGEFTVEIWARDRVGVWDHGSFKFGYVRGCS